MSHWYDIISQCQHFRENKHVDRAEIYEAFIEYYSNFLGIADDTEEYMINETMDFIKYSDSDNLYIWAHNRNPDKMKLYLTPQYIKEIMKDVVYAEMLG